MDDDSSSFVVIAENRLLNTKGDFESLVASIGMSKFAGSLAGLLFVILFPGYLIYHYALASEWVPPFLGGLFGGFAFVAACFCWLNLGWLLSRRSWGSEPAALAFLAVWGYFAIWTLAGIVSISEQPYASIALRESGSMLVFWTGMFFVGAYLPLDGRGYKIALTVTFWLILAVLIYAIVAHGTLLGPYIAFVPSEDSVSATYQGAGRSILITGIVAIALIRNAGFRVATFGLVLAALLLVGSRTYLVAGLTVVLGLLSAAACRRSSHLLLSVIFFIAAGIGIYLARGILLETRAVEILDLASSSSWRSRLTLQDNALDVIANAPLFGDFSYHIREIGSGGYAHNVFSAWTQFGIVGFILYILMLSAFFLINLLKMFTQASEDPVWRASFGLNMAALTIAFAEPVFSVVPPLAWGLTVNALRRRRHRWVVTRSE